MYANFILALGRGPSMTDVRKHLVVEGYVQGVFFRASTRDKAQELRVTGWVRNQWDGTVEVLVEGEESRVAEFIRWCHHGPPGANVNCVRVEEELYRGEFDGFHIRYG